MEGMNCPCGHGPSEWLSTTNEWDFYCRTCDKRFNREGQFLLKEKLSAMPLNLAPTEDRVVIKMADRKGEAKLASGLYVPATAEDAPVFGTVLAVGPGRLLDDGSHLPLTIQPGDYVVVGKYAGNIVTLDEQEFIIVHASEILAIAISEDKVEDVGATD